MIESLPRREREVFETLCSLEEGTATAVRAALSDPISDSAVRTLLGRLAARGLVAHRTVNQAYVYAPVSRPAAIGEKALQRVVSAFFEGSAVSAATALLGMGPAPSSEEIEALRRLIDDAWPDTTTPP